MFTRVPIVMLKKVVKVLIIIKKKKYAEITSRD